MKKSLLVIIPQSSHLIEDNIFIYVRYNYKRGEIYTVRRIFQKNNKILHHKISYGKPKKK